MDCFEQITHDAQFSVSVFLNRDHTDVELVSNMPHHATPKNLHRNCVERGLAWVGVIGLVEGKPQHAFIESLPAETLSRLSRAFCAYFETLLKSARADEDFTAFMANLCALPDTRIKREL